MPRVGELVKKGFTSKNPTDGHEHCSDSTDASAAAMTQDATNTPSGSESSIDDVAATWNGSDEMSKEETRNILLNHPLPKARQRTNIVSDDYIPEGQLFGALTTRGEGITQATFRFPLAGIPLCTGELRH